MADNITLNSGNGGATLAADDITSVWYQIVKLAFGALDSATLVVPTAGLPVALQQSATPTTSSVADSATSAQLLAANTSRKGATIVNTSSALLYIKCGTTATTTDFTAVLGQRDYWEVPFGYTGRIDGIWATDPGDGAAQITEFT